MVPTKRSPSVCDAVFLMKRPEIPTFAARSLLLLAEPGRQGAASSSYLIIIEAKRGTVWATWHMTWGCGWLVQGSAQ